MRELVCNGQLWARAVLKARSHDPFLRIRCLLVPKNGSCEHIKNDLPSNGPVILKKRMEIEHALFSSYTLLERWKAPTNFAWSFWRQIEDSLLVLKNGSCEHIANDLPIFSPQKRNLEIGKSEQLLPVFLTENRILKNGSSERALRQLCSYKVGQREHFPAIVRWKPWRWRLLFNIF